jgi:hypothetical protein
MLIVLWGLIGGAAWIICRPLGEGTKLGVSLSLGFCCALTAIAVGRGFIFRNDAKWIAFRSSYGQFVFYGGILILLLTCLLFVLPR